MELTCGIDFDNTLISYDRLLAQIVAERGLLGQFQMPTKRVFRDYLRQLPNGEIEWQKCQALLYGSRIGEATLIPGVRRFLELARNRGMRTYIISHKTQCSPFASASVNLRTSALSWMTENGLFEEGLLGLSEKSVFFADDRRQKIKFISQLQCTHFIDDLEEVLLEDSFPPDTVRILYEPGRDAPAPAGITLVTSWREISHYFFGTE